MQKFYSYLLYAALLLLCYPSGETQSQMTKSDLLKKYPSLAAELNNSFEGRQFFFAMPPNEATGVNIQQRALEVYVTSRFDTEVTLEVPGLGIGPITKKVKAFEITTFSDQAAELSWAMEVRTSELVTDKAIIVTAEDPVKVWGMSAKRFCSEGFAVRPIKMWGREYRHLGYYDYPEAQTVRGGGFLIIAQENETSVEIELKGTNAGGTTVEGKSTGDKFSVTLNRGQTYMIRGTGQDRAFDLTGSSIKATKAIGVISFHERTIIPTSMGQSSRDALMEMLPPADAFGTRHVSLELFRENTGDYFRIMAHEPNTEFEVKYYAKDGDRELIGVRTGVLTNPGQWAEYEEVNPAGGIESIRGTAVWESNKPVLIMQYSYSSGWDNNQDFDPFMMLVPPVEQFLIGANMISTPSNAEFNTNWVNILVQAPETPDPNQTLLREVELDGTPISVRDPLFLSNLIPGTRLHWARINVAPGGHVVSSPLPFTSHTYGFSRFESYGWTDGLTGNAVNTDDIVAPEIDVDISDPEVVEIVVGDGAQGLVAVELIEGESENATLTYLTDLSTGAVVKTARVQVRKIDPALPANALILARDRAGNVSVEEVRLEATAGVTVTPTNLDFGLVRVGESMTQSLKITNSGSAAIAFESLSITPSNNFTVLQQGFPISILGGESLELTVEYTPTRESASTEIEDDEASATLFFSDEVTASFEVRGQGGLPMLEINSPAFDRIEAGQVDCQDPGMTLTNEGTYELTITGMDSPSAPFVLEGGLPQFPQKLAPGASLEIGRICFVPAEFGEFEQQVSIISDADDSGSQTVVLRGMADRPSNVQENSEQQNNRLQIYPNPVSSRVTLNWVMHVDSEVELSIVDARGIQVLTRDLGLRPAGAFDMELDLSSLATGRYFVILKGEGLSLSRSLTITR